MGTPATGSVDSLESCNSAMHRLLLVTLRTEKLTAIRDREIAAIQTQYAGAIDKAAADMVLYESQIEEYCRAHPEAFDAGKKSVQLSNGLMGLRSSTPALEPLSDKWDWSKIEAKVREFWKSKYFHAPKAPALDKAKIKKSLDEAQLKECGLKLAVAENFYLELNRLAPGESADIAA